MDVTEFCPLTEEAICNLLEARQGFLPRDRRNASRNTPTRRQVTRWPFPGTVELWIPDRYGVEQYTLGSCVDLSRNGAGVQCDRSIPVGMELALAIHQPEATFHGRATVRHCSPRDDNEYYIGVEFSFEKHSI
ncbi:MAG: PilZ domain-containing protein [Planctomycetota bacterium]